MAQIKRISFIVKEIVGFIISVLNSKFKIGIRRTRFQNSKFILSFVLFLLPFALSAQNHPELNWRTFESEHFIFHYHEGTERSARMALTIAEEIYPHVTGLYQWEPEDKTQIIIQDTDDYANGGAYYFDNKILLWASPADFTLRGNHNWMRNVLTHEFAHIVSLGKSMRFPISIPAGFIQILNREKPVRDNIILE
ncbi:MAG: hypothetical protein KAI81_07910, partial [Candidatus Marinimicrobia bacterium]|nr:hypothetical protein [Candidatus Neomarinimicrobiota bacterium]